MSSKRSAKQAALDSSEDETEMETAFEASKRQKIERKASDSTEALEPDSGVTAEYDLPPMTQEMYDDLLEGYRGYKLYWSQIDLDDVGIAFTKSSASGRDANASLFMKSTMKDFMVLTPPGYVRFCKFGKGMGSLQSYNPPETKFCVTDPALAKFQAQLFCWPAHELAAHNEMGYDQEMLGFYRWLEKLWHKFARAAWTDPVACVSLKKEAMSETKAVLDTRIKDREEMLRSCREDLVPKVEQDLLELRKSSTHEDMAFKHFMDKLTYPPVKMRKNQETKEDIPLSEHVSVACNVFSRIYENNATCESGYAHLIPDVKMAEEAAREARRLYDEAKSPEKKEELKKKLGLNYKPPKFIVRNKAVDPVTGSKLVEDGALVSFLLSLRVYAGNMMFGHYMTGIACEPRRVFILDKSKHDSSIWTRVITDDEIDKSMPMCV